MKMIKRLCYFTAIAAAAMMAIGVDTVRADEITVVSWGGKFQEAERKAFFEPTAKILGITIKEDTLSSPNEVRVQVRAGAVRWDVVELGIAGCARLSAEGLLEKLDYSVIDTTGIPQEFVKDDWVGILHYSNVLAWNKDTYGENPPKNWADFYDVEKFPGTRAMRNDPTENFEIALLADGVSPDKLYPLDLGRALKKLAELKPHVKVWWKSEAQSVQLLIDGEVDMISLWSGALIKTIKQGASNIGYTYNQGILSADCLVIPKGSKNKKLAEKAISQFISPELQANLPLHIDYGPVNSKAFETGKIPADIAKTMNSSPENAALQVPMDPSFWAKHRAEARERMDNMLQE
jgi:putative spermidine/putrescine transport system substrate-binding protein